MSLIRVSLFGKFHVQIREQTLESFDMRKVQELFCYLLLNRGHPHPREGLASLLWSDNSTAQSKSYLRKALWQLQSALDHANQSAASPVLLVEPEWVQLNPEANVWLDVAEFEQAFNLTQGMPGRSLNGSQVQALERAVSVYGGDLLEGCYYDWCLFERERLQYLYLAMLDKLMDYCEAHQKYEAGLVYGTCILRYDRARERTQRRLMRLHYLAGDRTEALRQYDRCVAALDEELGVEPSERTLTLYRHIRTDRLEGVLGSGADFKAGYETGNPPLSKVLVCLQQLHSSLAKLQSQVLHDIQTIESSINNHR